MAGFFERVGVFILVHFLSFSWVALMVGFLEVYNGEFGVVFEGVEGFVAEHFFDVVEVGACADHFGGAASAEGVEGDAGLEVCVFGVVVEDSAQCVVGHFLSCVVEEEGLLLGPYSIRNLKYNLLRFLTWLDQNKGVDTLQGLRYAHGSAWLTHLTAYRTSKGKPLHPRSINKQVECIRCFLEYLYRQGLVRPQLLQAFEYVKQPRVLPNSILTHAEMRALLESIPTDTSEGYRDRTLFELLYSSGIRAGEILGIQLTDLDLENQTVLVTGKGNKQRVVPIGNTATRFLTSYLAAVRPALEYNPLLAAV